MQENLGVVVGRFQVAELHEGHKSLLRFVAARHKRVLVVLAEAATLPTERNPLSVSIRKGMLMAWWKRENISATLLLASIRDVGEPGLWSARLDGLIAEYLSDGEEAVCYGSRESFISVYRGRFPTVFVPEANAPSGMQTRECLVARLDHSDVLSADFRAGMIAEVSMRPPRVYTTVDVAVRRGDELLLARKERDKGAWRLVGGFVDASDASLEAAAARELMEETGVCAREFRFLKSCRVDDWRYRGTKDVIMTSLFMARYQSGNPRANDDIVDARFFPLSSLPTIVPVHMTLVEHVVKACL